MPRKPPPNEAGSPFFGLIIVAATVGIVAWSYLSNRPDYDQTYYAEAISPEIPLPPGFTYDVGETQTLTTLEEQVTGVYSEGSLAKFEVLNFYNDTLPALGWIFQKYTVYVDGEQATYKHASEPRTLDVKVARYRGDTQLILTERKPLSDSWDVLPPFLPGEAPTAE